MSWLVGEDMAGVLADIFDGAGAKYLTAVEIDGAVSHQHEFNGVAGFRAVLGETGDPVEFPATYYWLDDDEDSDPACLDSYCTWGDVRRGDPNRSEYRLYYPAAADDIVGKASAGDLLIVAKTNGGKVLVVVCMSGTTVERQLLWLFGLSPTQQRLDAKPIRADESPRLGFAAWSILDDLGVGLVPAEPDVFGLLVDRFGDTFPSTREFSQFARETLSGVDPMASPDDTLVAWMDHEEALFRHLERHVVDKRLRTGFVKDGQVDVDGFTEFSLSVQNRRKSRAGWALGHHVAAVLECHGVRFAREARTEGKKKPDFLFPGDAEYADAGYDETLLTMLGAKRTCKDRWRQVLSEANRITNKHLLTLEPSISSAQTSEMMDSNLQLVVPRGLFGSYDLTQREWLMDFAGFMELVRGRQ